MDRSIPLLAKLRPMTYPYSDLVNQLNYTFASVCGLFVFCFLCARFRILFFFLFSLWPSTINVNPSKLGSPTLITP